MAQILTRTDKGTPLTFGEMDSNLINLNNAKMEAGNTGAVGQVLTKQATGNPQWADVVATEIPRPYGAVNTVLASNGPGNALFWKVDQDASEQPMTLTTSGIGRPDGTTLTMLDTAGYPGVFKLHPDLDYRNMYATTHSWSAAQVGVAQSITTTSASLTINFATANNFIVTCDRNCQLIAPQNIAVGQSGIIVFISSGAARTLTFATNYKFAGGTPIGLTQTAGAVDLISYFCYETNKVFLGAIGDIK